MSFLNDVQFNFIPSEGGDDPHEVDARHAGYQVGRMLFSPSTGEVRNIWSDVPRQGVATGLWNHARELGYEVKHSPNQTKKGKRWANKVGGPAVDPDQSYDFGR